MSVDQGQVELTRDPHDKDPHRKKQQRGMGEGSEKKDLREGERRRKSQLNFAQNLRDKLDLVDRLMQSKSLSKEEVKQIIQSISPQDLIDSVDINAMSEAPKVYCEKEEKEIPVWHCFGSYTPERDPCPDLLELRVSFDKPSKIKCKKQDKTQ